MSIHDPVWRSGEDVQLLENVLKDTPTSPETRRSMVRRASLGLLGATSLGAVIAGCGSSSSKAKSSSSSSSTSTTSTSSSSSAASQIQKTIDVAATAEALAVTYLTAVVTSPGVSGTKLKPYLSVLKAANVEEEDHYRALTSLGAKPVATKFWAPNDFFGTQLNDVLPTLEAFETLFVNAYLIATTTFAQAGKASMARYAGEIGGVEAEHLALVRYAAGKLPNDVGFQGYAIDSIDGIVSAIEATGVGLGTKGSKPGKFVNYATPPSSAVTTITNNTPA